MYQLKQVAIMFAIMLVAFGCSKKKAVIDGLEENTKVIEAPAPVPETKIEPLPAPTAVEIPDGKEKVYFEFDRYNLSNQSLEILHQIGQTMEKNPMLNVTIKGHACPIGSYEYNMALGEHRGLEAQRWLLNYGIDGVRIRVISYGEEEQYLATETASEYEMNRRDEFEYTLSN